MDGKATTSEITTGRSLKCNTSAVIQHDAGAVAEPPLPNISSTNKHKTNRPRGFWTCFFWTCFQRPTLLAMLAGITLENEMHLCFPFWWAGSPSKPWVRPSGHGNLSTIPKRCLPPCISSATARLLQASAGVSLNQGQVCSKQPCTSYAQATDTQALSFSQIESFKGRFGWWFCLVYNPAYLWGRVWGRTTGVGIRMGPFSLIFPCSLRGKRDLLLWAEQAGSSASRQHDYISGVPTGKQKTEE